MAASRHQEKGVASQAERSLHRCSKCDSHLVHPVAWRQSDPDHWTVLLRCPNCEWCASGTYAQELVDDFDRELDDGAEALVRDLCELARANMAEAVDSFVLALQADAVLPEDF